MDQDPRGVLSPAYKRYLDGREDLGSVRVPVDRVPSVEFGGMQHSQVRFCSIFQFTASKTFD